MLDNDTDADADPLTAVLVDDATNGTLSLNTDGSFTYAPDANYFGTDTFTYVANDGTENSNEATVTITVNPVNDPPISDAGPDQTVTVGELVALDGSASTDPFEGDQLAHQWTFDSRPAGSIATLSDPDTVGPTFIPDRPGVYVVELTVDDGNGGVDTDSVTVTASVMGMTLTLEDPLIGAGRSTNGAISLEYPAPPGGLTVTLSLDTGIATVDPIAVFIAQGATEGTFTVTGVDVGTTTIEGTSPATVTATAEIGVTDALISIDDIPVIAPDETADLPVSITKPAPPGGVTITFESLDPSIAITEPTAFVPEGLYVPSRKSADHRRRLRHDPDQGDRARLRPRHPGRHGGAHGHADPGRARPSRAVDAPGVGAAVRARAVGRRDVGPDARRPARHDPADASSSRPARR